MDYRPATIADAAVLAAMNKHLIEDEGHRNPMSVAELEQRMAGWLGGEYEAVLFMHDSHPAGYALFRREPDHIYLRQFFVSRECRRAGIGRAAMAWLRANPWRGASRIRIDVLIDNHAGIAFWHSVGLHDYSVAMELDNQQDSLWKRNLMAHTLIPQRIASAERGENPTVICRMKSGYLVMADKRCRPGRIPVGCIRMRASHER